MGCDARFDASAPSFAHGYAFSVHSHASWADCVACCVGTFGSSVESEARCVDSFACSVESEAHHVAGVAPSADLAARSPPSQRVTRASHAGTQTESASSARSQQRSYDFGSPSTESDGAARSACSVVGTRTYPDLALEAFPMMSS